MLNQERNTGQNPTSVKHGTGEHRRVTGALTRRTVCPSCGTKADFTRTGEQRWPARVAAAAGMPEVITLWTCGFCGTTRSELDLKFS
ncbi:MAG: hypothetical protein SF029_20465 [bacterium]|nr:hypothetical protein [bacterium]